MNAVSRDPWLVFSGFLILVGVMLGLSSCRSPRSKLPNIAKIYKEAALDELRNPVIVVHGTLGSRLVERSSGNVVWGAFTSEVADPETPQGARALALPFEIPKDAKTYNPDDCQVYADGPLESLQLGGIYRLFSVEIYADIIRTLGAGGFRDEVVDSPHYAEDHYSCFTFFYDWRRDNVENAIQLQRFIETKKGEVEDATINKIKSLRDEGLTKKADRLEAWLSRGVRFDIVSHSMGSLLARYFLRFGGEDLPRDGSVPEVTWKGAESVDRLIMIAPPNLGSMEALRRLCEGFAPSFVLPHFDAALLATMPSIYQVLPRVRHSLISDQRGREASLDFFDPEVWKKNKWGIFSEGSSETLGWLLDSKDPNEAEKSKAWEYVAWCLGRSRQFQAALDQVPEVSSPVDFYLFAADAEDTLTFGQVVEGQAGRKKLNFDDDSFYREGDQSVARYSAVADERFPDQEEPWIQSPIRWSQVTFLSDDHLGITKNPHFVNNVLFVLLDQKPRPRRP